jgi:hypothetical protein
MEEKSPLPNPKTPKRLLHNSNKEKKPFSHKWGKKKSNNSKPALATLG